MAYVELAKGHYPKARDVFGLAWYIYDLSKCIKEVYGGKNIIMDECYNPMFIAQQFCAVQRGQAYTRGLYHLVISFDPYIDNANLMFANNVAQRICNLYPNYQSFFAVHENTKALHIHIMFNNCPIFENCPKLTSLFNIMTVRGIVDEMIDRHLGII